MAFDARVTVIGNTTRDVDLKFSASGNPWATFTVAAYEGKDKTGEERPSSFFDVKLFGDSAERAAESIRKGTRVMVSGKLTQERWEKDGQKRSKVVVIAEEVAVSVRWATATVHKAERSGDRHAPPPVQAQDYGPDDAPF